MPTLTSIHTPYTPRLSSNRLLAGSHQFTVPVSTARAALPMALRVAVAPAPFSSLNSRSRRKKAYPLLDLHQNPMNAIPNQPPPNLRIPKRTHLSVQPPPRRRPSRRSSRVPLPPRNPPPLSRARRPSVKSHISHEHVENIWRYLGLAGVLANLPLPSLGGLLRPLSIHRQLQKPK